MEYKNYLQLRKFSLRYVYYCIIDADEYLADELFIRHKVKVKFEHEYAKHGTKYLCIFCKIKKKDKLKFLQALEELKSKMLLLGYLDYQKFCEELSRNILEKMYNNC